MNAARQLYPDKLATRSRPRSLSLSLMLTACFPQDQDIDQRINAWMWCDECIEQQRLRVEELGERGRSDPRGHPARFAARAARERAAPDYRQLPA